MKNFSFTVPMQYYYLLSMKQGSETISVKNYFAVLATLKISYTVDGALHCYHDKKQVNLIKAIT